MKVFFAIWLISLTAISLSLSAAIAGEPVNYSVNGEEFKGYFKKPNGKSKGLVLIIHDWDGLTDYEVKRAGMLADLGYTAFAVDLYGKGNRPVETKAKKAETKKLYDDREKMRTLILGGLAEARKRESAPVVVMGYCFGGAATLELARSGKGGNVKGYASFHGGLKTPEGQSYSEGTAPIFVAHGGADAAISMDDVANLSKTLEKAEVPYDIEVYSGAPHAFTVFGSKRYREKADKKSWTSFLNFLQENLGN